ncbi:protein tyrosine kinase [Rhodococcus sp. WWJCD1]|uniref:polysaccharide biosynthesis tyrosine autokinase n=1 Tax=unclassified Rhodococcus (in: high G+C Gram-positive bacteria) TaxID=192944 RepID=UPI000B9AA318|nr:MULTISPECIES: polysaccharide biosynthesis tyrosine autokinase [unclassified Rhodococcus (in: high G+C Gram-positive bacteria)]OZC50989.1 protein tyrosine kinase [Rhodococcus sp. WWJCD1]OZE83883.1 protein tyrosine kinase [Rhodococcus sp. 15-649-2-2]
MLIREYAAALKARWLIIVATTIVGTTAAVLFSLLSTPAYQATTRFFVSTTAITASDVYQSNLASQQRVVSYAELLTGRTLAQRVVDQLSLPIGADALSAQIEATSTPNSVLLDASVLDTSPLRARDIANALGEQFPALVSELETPADGGTASASVAVAEAAETPTAPVTPKKLRNVILGMTIGLLVGIAGALVRDRLDNTVKKVGELQELTDSVLVGTIPYAKKVRDTAAIDFGRSTAPVAEAYRELRMNLKFLAVDNPPRLLLITSSIAGEGKSVTAVNLALSLAEVGNRVVLVDADLRRPRISEYLDIVGSVGVSSVLAHEATVDEVIQTTTFNNLWALGAGPAPPNPSELLGSAAAQSLLHELRRAFDYVVVDSPPVLPVTDAATLATQCDGTILVTRYGFTRRDEVSRAAANLETIGAPLLGVVMSVVPTSKKSEYRYGYDFESGRTPARVPTPPTISTNRH